MTDKSTELWNGLVLTVSFVVNPEWRLTNPAPQHHLIVGEKHIQVCWIDDQLNDGRLILR
jgi:hypothetical protein